MGKKYVSTRVSQEAWKALKQKEINIKQRVKKTIPKRMFITEPADKMLMRANLLLLARLRSTSGSSSPAMRVKPPKGIGLRV